MSFKLQANPTFKAPVNIPVPGEKAEAVMFTFKHKTRAQFDALITGLASGDEHIDNAVKEVVIEWVYPGVEYSPEALDQCLDMFPGSALAIFAAYRDNLLEARRKN
jgi:hypothetical protein